MEKTLSELAQYIGGTVIGDGTQVIRSVAPIHLSGAETITFLLDVKRASDLDGCRAAAVVVPVGFRRDGIACLEVENVAESFDRLAALYRPPRTKMIRGIDAGAFVDESATIGQGVSIGHGAYVGAQVSLGDGCTIYPNAVILDGSKIGNETKVFPNATIYENCEIGKNCLIHAGAVIGGYGFGYDSSAAGHKLSAQLGNVVLEDNVEVGACSTIDRATHGSTRIGLGTKIDNLVMIAHNCRLGQYNLICAHTGIAGSTTTGDFVIMAGRVGVRDHIEIGDRAVLGAMAGVMGSVPADVRIVGIPATPEKEQMKKQVALAKLPEMRREFIAMKNEVRRLSEELAKLTKETQG